MIDLENGRRNLYQWDSNQRVIVGHPAGTVVHFYHSEWSGDDGLTLHAYEDAGVVYANIPNIFLTKAGTLRVYIFITEGDGGYTEEKREFIVEKKTKPSDYAYTETEVLTWSALAARIDALEKGGPGGGQPGTIDEETVRRMVEEVVNGMGLNNINAKIGAVTLLAANWVGDATLHSQVVDIEGVTENSQVDLTPSAEQLVIFYEKDLTFVTENDGGVVTVYAIGQKPENDYTIQVTITEVDV